MGMANPGLVRKNSCLFYVHTDKLADEQRQKIKTA